MMLRTLYAKLALALVVLLLSMGLVYAVISLSATRHYLREVNQLFNRNLARNLVSDRNLVEEGRLNEAKLKETFHHYMVVNPSIEIYLLDREGKILAYSADPAKVKRRRVALGPIRRFLNGAPYPVLGDDPRSLNRRKAFSVTPIPTAASPQGYLYVVLRGEQYDAVDRAAQESYFLRLSAWTVLATLVFGLVTGLGVFHLLTRRLHRLTALMDGFRGGDVSTGSRYGMGAKDAGDEIDRLGATFDAMADRIGAQVESLRRQDTLRRDLVAQVSHDLRTPLASLHGYLETLQMKGPELSEHERSDYVATALRHSERLGRLVSELFELAKLEAQESVPHPEAFAPAELAQDVVQKFRLAAEQRGVELAMELGDDRLVVADIGLIERVLDNLIENALNHTPAGGRVILRVGRSMQGVTLTVRDTGCGIPEADLPHIFDRFRQAGGRDRGGDHAGLGLAIAKRVLELHGSDISVCSRPGEGATFAFTLPVAQEPTSGL